MNQRIRVLQELGEEFERSLATPRSSGPSIQPRLANVVVLFSVLITLAVAGLAIVLLGHGHRAASRLPASPNPHAVPNPGDSCRSDVHDGVLPPWVRAGFSDPKPRMRYVLGTSGRIAALLFGPLNSPPAADHNNKILWVSRAATPYGHDLSIEAQRMTGTKPLGGPVSRTVTGGPGPSIINLPSPGCWRLSLQWSRWTDTLDLQYKAPG